MSPAPEMEAAERQICPLMPHPHGSSQKTAGYQGYTNKGTIKDADGKTVTIKGSNETVYVQGDSAYTVTVDSYTV